MHVRESSLSFHSVYIVLGIALAGAPALAQSAWTKQAPIPTSADLHGIAVVSASELWACGGDGLLIHTTNNGQTWDTRQLATNSLWGIDFLDAQHGWAVGNGFFHTTNGGQTWVQDNNWGSIYDVRFLDAQHGWACGNGGVTYRSTDGGSTWAYREVGSHITLSSIYFVDPLTGWTVNIDGRIYRSTDGGQSWTLQHDANGYLSTLQFFDAQEGWAIGGNTFLHTTNGGQNWSQAIVPSGTWSHAARFADRQHGISVGEYGNVTITSDFGQSWTEIHAIGTGPRLWDVESSSAAISFYAGETGGLARTADGGASWNSLQSGGAGYTHGLDAVDPLHAWAANDAGEVLYTINGGTHWQRVAVAGFDNYGRVEDVDFFDTQLGWAVGRHEVFGGGFGQVARSNDGGQSWQLQHSVAAGYFDDVEVLDSQTVLALGNVPLGPRFILRTTDAGQSWIDVAPSQAVFMDADFIDTSTGWVVGGLIYKSTNGGQTWVQQGGTPPDLLQSVSFADSLNGWAVGWSTTILHTTDGGQTWTPQDANALTNVLFEVQAFSPSRAVICGGDGYVARTEDGGQTWIREIAAGETGPFETLFFLDPDRGWLGGNGIWFSGSAPDVGTAFCSGDGSGTACPCGNAGGAEHGCGSSLFAQGASLDASGVASLSGDSVGLHASELPNSSVLFLQGTTRMNGGAGVLFGDGLRCVGGAVIRLGTRTAAANAASFGAGASGDPLVSVQGQITAPGARTYQAWYRNAAAFCTSANFNLTNGLEILWTP